MGGFGGIIKSVVKVVATVVGGIACGAPCAAVGAAVATGATGGSFKDALLSGATAFIGAKVTAGVSGAITDSAANFVDPLGPGALTNVQGIPFSQGATGLSSAAASSLSGGAIPAIASELVSTPLEDVPLIGEAASKIVGPSGFLNTTFGTVNGVNRTPFDIIADIGDKTFSSLGFDTTPFAINTAADLVAAGAGGLTDLTLNQALNADLPGLDETLSQKYNPQQIAALRNEARNQLSQQAFDRLVAGTTNPGLADDEFQKVMAAGIERENQSLGPDITETQFNQVFDNPDLGSIILQDEEDLRRQAFNQDIGRAFPGDAFGAIDDDIINAIVEERQGPAQEQIGAFAARGNLNPTGGLAANEFIQKQVPQARERVTELGQGVLGRNQDAIDAIRDRASAQVSGFQLGDDLFDITPFAEERQGIIDVRGDRLESDLRGAIEGSQLFDVSGALRAGGREQGVVSGTPNPSFLDTIAERERGATSSRNIRRTLGSKGAF